MLPQRFRSKIRMIGQKVSMLMHFNSAGFGVGTSKQAYWLMPNRSSARVRALDWLRCVGRKAKMYHVFVNGVWLNNNGSLSAAMDILSDITSPIKTESTSLCNLQLRSRQGYYSICTLYILSGGLREFGFWIPCRLRGLVNVWFHISIISEFVYFSRFLSCSFALVLVYCLPVLCLFTMFFFAMPYIRSSLTVSKPWIFVLRI